MQRFSPVWAQNSTQEATTLHILSNFAVGQTTLDDFWCEQITSLRQRALAFQECSSDPVPSITRTTEAFLHGSGLFDFRKPDVGYLAYMVFISHKQWKCVRELFAAQYHQA